MGRAAALSAFAIALIGFAQRVRIDCDDRVELLVVEGDPCQVLLNQFARRGIAILHGPLHISDTGFDNVEFSVC